MKKYSNIVVSGSISVTGSLDINGSVTLAAPVTSASYALTASYVEGGGGETSYSTTSLRMGRVSATGVKTLAGPGTNGNGGGTIGNNGVKFVRLSDDTDIVKGTVTWPSHGFVVGEVYYGGSSSTTFVAANTKETDFTYTNQQIFTVIDEDTIYVNIGQPTPANWTPEKRTSFRNITTLTTLYQDSYIRVEVDGTSLNIVLYSNPGTVFNTSNRIVYNAFVGSSTIVGNQIYSTVPSRNIGTLALGTNVQLWISYPRAYSFNNVHLLIFRGYETEYSVQVFEKSLFHSG